MNNLHTSRAFSRGFTLIETIMYLAIFGILMSGAIVAAYSLLEGGGRNVTAIQIQEEGTFLNRKLNYVLTGATAEDLNVSEGGTKLKVKRLDLEQTITLAGNGTSVTLQRDGGAPLELTSGRYEVTGPASGAMFTIVPASGGKPSSVTTSFRVEGKPFLFRTYVRQ
jgi:prepilin-type N-terminal cleavage/methylation domain-containing protein